MIKKATLISSFFLLSTAHAVFERQVYCFHKKIDEYAVRVTLGDLLHPQDSFMYDKSMNCLTLVAAPRRLTLYSRLLDKRYTYETMDNPQRGITSESSQCLVNIKKVIKSKAKGTSAQVGRRTGAVASDSRSNGAVNSQLRISNGKTGSLNMDGEEVKLICQKSPQQVTIQVHIKDSGGNSLSTTLSLRPGQEQDLGSIVKDLKNKRRSLGIPSGVDWAKNEGKIINQYFISVK